MFDARLMADAPLVARQFLFQRMVPLTPIVRVYGKSTSKWKGSNKMRILTILKDVGITWNNHPKKTNYHLLFSIAKGNVEQNTYIDYCQ